MGVSIIKNIWAIVQHIKGKGLNKTEPIDTLKYLEEPTKPYNTLKIPKARLTIIESPHETNLLTVDLHPGFSVGRGRNCDLVLTDPNASRIHARFKFADDAWLIKDNFSKNGLLHNGKKADEALLCDGDKIVLGRTVLIYEDKS
ncbi:MAG: FHA domain-containing protein [Bacillota bacterium]|nr:FHA domain-containing protein [Bacillota bacterium]HHU62337.1 FHA domain-containing protein [Natronincola sp.]